MSTKKKFAAAQIAKTLVPSDNEEEDYSPSEGYSSDNHLKNFRPLTTLLHDDSNIV